MWAVISSLKPERLLKREALGEGRVQSGLTLPRLLALLGRVTWLTSAAASAFWVFQGVREPCMSPHADTRGAYKAAGRAFRVGTLIRPPSAYSPLTRPV